MTADVAALPAHGGSRRMRTGIRARVMATVLTLTVGAMALAGVVLVLAQRAAAASRADHTIVRAVDQFRAMAASGGGTGRPFTGVGPLLQSAVQHMVPADDETFLGMMNGRPAWFPPGKRPVRLETDAGILSTVARLPATAPVRIRDASTATGEVRYAAVQVRVAGKPQVGTYLVAISMNASQQAIAQNAEVYALVALGSLVLVGVAGWAVEGQFNRNVNALLGHLESGFQEQQRLLDDAGHELRTPVTVVSGHLEVLDVTDPSEVAEVRDLVLDEMARTDRLIADLTALAKARRPDFVQPAPVNLARLTDEVIGKASALGQRRWTLDARASGVIMADAQRLTQALLQLAANAVRYTADGDLIAIGSELSGTQARLWVRDSGPGVAPADADRIFDRYAQGAGCSSEGSGLGLAIVTAIASAHGGRVHLDSPPGEGATFSLILPADH